jgi:hypothetical protein
MFFKNYFRGLYKVENSREQSNNSRMMDFFKEEQLLLVIIKRSCYNSWDVDYYNKSRQNIRSQHEQEETQQFTLK